MAQEYTIKQVSQQEPKRYDGKYGTTFYHKVRFEGSDDIIEIGRKEGNAPKQGEKVFGTITENEYGKSFKPEKNPNGYSGGRQPRDDAAIQAQFSIKAAIEYHDKGTKLSEIEATAKELFAMIGRVKGGVSESKPSLAEKWNEVQKAKEEVVEVPDEITDEDIDLSEIPF